MKPSTARVGSREELLWQAEGLLREMRIGEAIEAFHLAEQGGSSADACAAGRWTCHMLAGGFEEAWRESDAIKLRANPDPHRFWDGQPLDGRNVVIRCLHGLGDTLQFIRYAPLVRERARSLTVEAQPSLKALLEASNLAEKVITWGDREPNWDQQIEVIELPRVFRTTVASIPEQVPYLRTPSACSIDLKNDGQLKVGLVWRAGGYNPLRSIEAAQAARLFDVPGTRFFSLQAGPERLEMNPWAGWITSVQGEEISAAATAAIVRQLDLVITVDTMMAHLAGALACPVWTLIPYRCDWRWMIKREDSPWYPSMRLFRQSHENDWDAVIERVRLALHSRAGQEAGQRVRLSERGE